MRKTENYRHQYVKIYSVFVMLMAYTLLTGFKTDPEKPKKRPNILLILVDDLKPALGAYGDTIAQTPHLDRFSAKGVRFEKAYSNQAVCAPSRINLMLGARSTSSGIYHFGQNFRDYYPDALTMPQFFKEQGYHAESMGKVYHIGHNTYGDEASWSVPHHKELVIEYVDPKSKENGFTREEALFSNQSAQGLPRGLGWESPDVADDAYADGRVANRAVERLKQLKENPDQPFFLAVGFARPHLPFSVPKSYWDLYDPEQFPLATYQKAPVGAPAYAVKRDTEIDQYIPIPSSKEEDPFNPALQRKLIHGYYAGVSYVDAQIGKVLSALERFDLDDNTIVVVWGDHGYHLGELGIWTKHVNFELANRIPVIMAGPGITQRGDSTQQILETVDIYPTLVQLAGLDRPQASQPMDGLNMAEVLRDPELEVRDHAYHSFPRGGRLGRAIRTARYRMVEWKEIGSPDNLATYELYDYKNGDVELKNIAEEQPEVLEELKAILATHPEAAASRPLSAVRGQ